MKSRNLFAAAAAAGMVLAPIAAQAGTRASSASVPTVSVASAVPGGRATASVANKNGVISDTVLALIGTVAFGTVIAIILSSGSNKKSGGTG